MEFMPKENKILIKILMEKHECSYTEARMKHYNNLIENTEVYNKWLEKLNTTE